MIFKSRAIKIINIDEGVRLKPYYDHLGFPTWGAGVRIKDETGRTLGQWEALPKRTITIAQSEQMTSDCLDDYISKFNSNKDINPVWIKCNDTRKAVLLSMAHQMGFYGILKYKRMQTAIMKDDFMRAAHEILDSDAARDPKLLKRMLRNSEMMKTGDMLDYYK